MRTQAHRWQLIPGVALDALCVTLGIPFVIITVTATLTGFDQSLIRASASLGANPRTTFFKVVMPLILPGVISGALFAFVTSFDEVVAVLFIAGPDQQTIPRQMFNGIREAISPAILAVATILVIISIGLLATVEALRRRSPGVVLIERDHEGFGKPGQHMRDGLIGIRSAQDSRCPETRCCSGESVDSALGDDDFPVLLHRWPEEGESGVRREITGRVQVARSVGSRVRNPDLRVDRVAVRHHG